MLVGVWRTVALAVLICVVAGCGRSDAPATTHAAATSHDAPLSGGGTAALSMCGQRDRYHFSGPRPPNDSATPQMVVMSYRYFSTGASDSGRITIRLSIAAGSQQAMTLGKPLGTEGPSVEIQGPDGVEVAAYGLPVKVISGPADGRLQVGPEGPLNYEVVVPSAAACPGHSLSRAVQNASMQRAGFSTLTVTISDPAIARHRAAQGVDASSDLLVAVWPPDPDAAAGGAETVSEMESLESGRPG